MHRLLRLSLISAVCASATLAGAQDLLRGSGPWVDDQARPVALETLHERATVLTLAYGACRRICSTSLRVLEQVQALADARGVAMDFVVIGLDPTQDLPADWAAFRQMRHLQRANWHFLTGTPTATQAMTRRMGVAVWRFDSHLMHDFKILLLSPKGQVLRSISSFDTEPEALLP